VKRNGCLSLLKQNLGKKERWRGGKGDRNGNGTQPFTAELGRKEGSVWREERARRDIVEIGYAGPT